MEISGDPENGDIGDTGIPGYRGPLGPNKDVGIRGISGKPVLEVYLVL